MYRSTRTSAAHAAEVTPLDTEHWTAEAIAMTRGREVVHHGRRCACCRAIAGARRAVSALTAELMAVRPRAARTDTAAVTR